MGGRGASSASKTSVSQNASNHERYVTGALGSKITRNDEFLMKMVYPDMNYWKSSSSKSSSYSHADRVSKDGNTISVLVPSERLKKTPYGYALQLDRDTVQYVKSWSVTAQTLPYKGTVGANVTLSKKYFNPKKTKYKDLDYESDAQLTTWEKWKSAAVAQQKAKNYVSIRN